MADQHAELDQQDLIELSAQLGPELIADPVTRVQLVCGPQQQDLTLGPALRLGPLAHAADLFIAEPDPPRHALVLHPLVGAAGVVGDPQDHQLGLLAGQLAARH